MLKELLKEMLREEMTGKKETTNSPWQIGKCYHVRTVTMDIAGKLKSIHGDILVFENASWVADSGRFNEYLRDTSKVSEAEPYKYDVLVNAGAMTDATEIDEVYLQVK